jgi:hypothetical protein
MGAGSYPPLILRLDGLMRTGSKSPSPLMKRQFCRLIGFSTGLITIMNLFKIKINNKGVANDEF